MVSLQKKVKQGNSQWKTMLSIILKWDVHQKMYIEMEIAAKYFCSDRSLSKSIANKIIKSQTT